MRVLSLMAFTIALTTLLVVVSGVMFYVVTQ